MPNDVSRRFVLSAAAALPLVAVTGRPAQALTTEEAQRLIQVVVDEILSAISAGGSESQIYAAFERIFQRHADVPTIARSTLGASARTASSAQLNAYAKSFQTYIARKYGKRFREFQGIQISVNNARAVKSFFEVNTTASIPREAPFQVTFLVSDRSGRDKFFDMVIEGISLLKTERSEIGALLDRRRGDLDQLTRDLPGLA